VRRCSPGCRGRAGHAPLEAFIGIVFATAQALAFLLLEKTPSGAEHIKETLVGSLFTVAPRHIAVVAGLYAAVSIVHFVLRKPFMEITNDPEGAKARGRRVFLWDFLFYATFGVVVTSAVQIAGVLLVFGFLVIPAVAGVIATPRTGLALAIGWAFAFGSSVVGLCVGDARPARRTEHPGHAHRDAARARHGRVAARAAGRRKRRSDSLSPCGSSLRRVRGPRVEEHGRRRGAGRDGIVVIVVVVMVVMTLRAGEVHEVIEVRHEFAGGERRVSVAVDPALDQVRARGDLRQQVLVEHRHDGIAHRVQRHHRGTQPVGWLAPTLEEFGSLVRARIAGDAIVDIRHPARRAAPASCTASRRCRRSSPSRRARTGRRPPASRSRAR
jgi:hypothetical protein